MDWGTELGGCGKAALCAAALVALVLWSPLRQRLTAAADRLAALPLGRALLLVVLLTVGARAALLPVLEPRYHADTKEYVEKAAAIADEGSPHSQEVRDTGLVFYRTLGYALPLAGWYRGTGTRGVLSARIFNVLLAGATAALIVLLGAAAGLARAGRAAALLFAVYLPHVQFAQVPYTETWATLLAVAAALAFERLRGDAPTPRARPGWAALLGLSLGALVITRTEFLWLPPLVLLAIAWARRARPATLLAPLALVVVGVALPLVVNHELRAGYPGHLRTSSQGGLILYFGNNAIDVNGHGNATPEVSRRVRELYREDPSGALARDEALAWMRAHPLAAIGNAPKKAYFLWLASPQGFGWEVARGEPGGMPDALAGPLRFAAYVQSLALLALGAFGLWRLRRRSCARAWTVVIALHLALWCVLAASPRNKLMLEPLLMIAASALVLRDDA